MKIFLLLIVSLYSLSISGQQVSTVPGAHGDKPNFLLANPNAASITNDLRATIWLDNDGLMKFRNVTGNGFAFRNHANVYDQVVFDRDGNLGIGPLNPRGRLHISGAMDGSSSIIKIGDSNPGNIAVPLGSAVGGYNIDFETWRDIVPVQTGARIRAERINTFAAQNALVQAMDLVFSTSTGEGQSYLSEKLRIRYDGNVGIGTSNPQAKLGVNGLIRAKEVKVEVQGWPDYVFADDYKLPSLSSIKAFIKTNHHLPGIPSAERIEAEGLSLGEMNRLLVQKIEELTLYAVEKDESDEAKSTLIDQQDKKIELLSKENRELSKRLERIEALLKSNKL